MLVIVAAIQVIENRRDKAAKAAVRRKCVCLGLTALLLGLLALLTSWECRGWYLGAAQC